MNSQEKIGNKIVPLFPTSSCKLSIKANMHLSYEAMEELLNELCQTDNPYNCPHGRPTIIKFSIYDLERMFKRVMN